MYFFPVFVEFLANFGFIFLVVVVVIFFGFRHVLFFSQTTGAMYWESAKSGTQQAVGCCSWFPSCVCPHADEAVSGIFLFSFFLHKPLAFL